MVSGSTDADGRCKALLSDGIELERGRYRVRFETGTYFASLGLRCLYPYVEIVFEVNERRHFHVPLLLTPNGYTTYRGS
jgi:5-hydroxyisourate hydrolase